VGVLRGGEPELQLVADDMTTASPGDAFVASNPLSYGVEPGKR
jgi:hypothetical protein